MVNEDVKQDTSVDAQEYGCILGLAYLWRQLKHKPYKEKGLKDIFEIASK